MLKRLIVIFFAITVLMPAFGQSVLGIPFGTSYEDAWDVLKQRFGLSSVRKYQGNIEITDFQMGGLEFDYGELCFQYQGDRTYLNAAHFQAIFRAGDVAGAKEQRDHLYSLMAPKYKDDYLMEFVNEEGFKCYVFGLNPKDPDMALGGFGLFRDKGRDGVKRLYLKLDYFPIEFVPLSSDF